jgi:UDP-N-acetylmuramoyl-tripeptide--D-alanyl-D-alanine ligase
MSIGFSRYSPSQYTAHGDQVRYDGAMPTGVICTVSHLDQSVAIHVEGSLGAQHAYTFAAALAVGNQLGVTLTEGAAALGTHTPPLGRMRVLRGIRGSVVIDDTYNSSPIASENAIMTLHELSTKGRKIAVLGDMLELGQFSVREHERIGEFLADKVDVLYTLGVRAAKIADGAVGFGLSEKNIHSYDTTEALIDALRPTVAQNDIILVKASQSIRAEKVVAALMNNPEDAGKYLVRQDEVWSKK